MGGGVRCLRATLAVTFAVMCLARCGSGSQTPVAPGGAPAATLFGVFPTSILLGPGDRGWLFAQAAISPTDPRDVTAATRWDSTNPSVVSVQGAVVTGVSPGEADLRASYQTFTATTHITVFPLSAIQQFKMAAALICWPNETFSWSAQAVLDTGVTVIPTNITWRSLDDRIVSVTPVETQNSTGTVGTDATIECRGAGSTRFEATYAGRAAVATVTVRAPRDLIEARGHSIRQAGGAVVAIGVTVFYLVESVASARIELVVRDKTDVSRVVASSSLTVAHGGGTVSLETSFPWQGTTANLCDVVEMVLASGARLRALGSDCPGF